MVVLDPRGDAQRVCAGLLISLDKEMSVARIHLLSQGPNLQFIPRIFEENQIMTAKTDASTIFSLMEHVLKKANEKRRQGMLVRVWTLDEKVFVKTSPGGTPIRIFDYNDLE